MARRRGRQGAGSRRSSSASTCSASRQAATRRQRLVIGGGLARAGGGGRARRGRADPAQRADHARAHERSAQLDDTEALATYATNPQESVAERGRRPRASRGARRPRRHLRARAGAVAPAADRSRLAAATEPDALWSPDGNAAARHEPRALARGSTGRARRAARWRCRRRRLRGVVAWDASGDRVLVGGATPGGLRRRHRPADRADARRRASCGRSRATAPRRDDRPRRGIGQVYVVATGRQMASFTPELHGGVTCFAWAPDGSRDRAMRRAVERRLDRARHRRRLEREHRRAAARQRDARPIGTVAFSPDSSRYVYTTTGTAPPSTGKSVSQQLSAEERAAGEPGTFVDETRSGAQVIAFAGSASAAVFGPGILKTATAAMSSPTRRSTTTSATSTTSPPASTAARGGHGVDHRDQLQQQRRGTAVRRGSTDGTTRVYDGSSGALLETLTDGDTGPVYDASFGRNNTAIATTARDGSCACGRRRYHSRRPRRP